ncbi:hypothetical protein QJS04_geneDACA014980 [Acorus gramineus]|uniref:Uncharacterized protein n=1 Tax=Acorus gramineus TaxID=55184 RepID=A0AAV9AJJ8_ACOGR|nr:hypothetical protein QJS04_geneDACA014980 [Acorus gramineus]
MLECPIAKQVWQRLAAMTEFKDGCSSLDELWRAGKSLRARGDKGVKAKVSHSFISAVAWALWIARNHLVFRGTLVYMENIWEMVMHAIKDWGRCCAGARSVSVRRGLLCIEE